MNDEFSQSREGDAMPAAEILRRADATIRSATACGALQAIRTSTDWIEDDGMRFPVRWIDALTEKPRRAPDADGVDPFLNPEQALRVGAAGPDHLILLNKYPVMPRHLLFVTRSFVPQTAPLEAADFASVAPLIAAAGGLSFYNAGEPAGASQPHRHLQWIPREDDAWLPLLAPLEQSAGRGERRCGRLPFDHELVPLADGALDPDALFRSYLALCQRHRIDCRAGRTPPYNLLITRRAMLIVARGVERCAGISINALGFAGSFFVSRPELTGEIRRRTPLAVLAAVARP